MLLWSLWHDRNEQLWEGKHVSSNHHIYRATSFLSYWYQAKNTESRVCDPAVREHQISWTAPIHGFLKNVMWMLVFSRSLGELSLACVLEMSVNILFLLELIRFRFASQLLRERPQVFLKSPNGFKA